LSRATSRLPQCDGLGSNLDVLDVVDHFTYLENTPKRKVATRVAVRYLSDPNARPN
jgi:hypothetical protein